MAPSTAFAVLVYLTLPEWCNQIGIDFICRGGARQKLFERSDKLGGRVGQTFFKGLYIFKGNAD